MAGRLIDRFQTLPNGVLIAILSVIVVVCLVRLQFLERGLPGGKLPDTRYLGYSAEELRQLFLAWGPEGQNKYLRASQTWDLVLPIGFGLLLATLFLSLRGESPPVWLVGLPILAAGADLLENGLIRSLIRNGIDPSSRLVELACATTIAKWSLIGASVATILLAVVKKRRRSDS